MNALEKLYGVKVGERWMLEAGRLGREPDLMPAGDAVRMALDLGLERVLLVPQHLLDEAVAKNPKPVRASLIVMVCELADEGDPK